jgi:hypothetical protein
MADKNAVVERTAEVIVHNHGIAENVVYLMGLSFIVGSLFTIFVLVVLDFMKRDRVAK